MRIPLEHQNDDDSVEAADLELGHDRDDPYQHAPLGSPYSDD